MRNAFRDERLTRPPEYIKQVKSPVFYSNGDEVKWRHKKLRFSPTRPLPEKRIAPF